MAENSAEGDTGLGSSNTGAGTNSNNDGGVGGSAAATHLWEESWDDDDDTNDDFATQLKEELARNSK